MRTTSRRYSLSWSFMPGLLALALVPGPARADVCLTIDEARDTFSPQERSAALLLLTRQFELAGERVVPPGCPVPYVVFHVQFGSTIAVTLSGPSGQRDATARGMDDVPAVHSQMVRSLLRGVPMDAPGIVDRTNVTETQGAPAKRIRSDSLTYARLGYGAVFGDRAYGGPSVGAIGYRKELDSFGIDVSFFNLLYRSSAASYGYMSSTRDSSAMSSWLKLEVLRFLAPSADRSPYVGTGMSWSTASLDHGDTNWSGSGLQGELTAGYEFNRASTIRVFIQVDAGLPFYRVTSVTYSSVSPFGRTTGADNRYAPSVTVSMGLGWQRGRG